MNYKRLVELAMLAGEIMLSGGAETYRVEDTMMHILRVSGFETAEAVVSGMAISVTLADDEECMISSAKRIVERQTDLGKVYQVNTISRQFCAGTISLNEAYTSLRQIKASRPYTNLQRFLANIGTVMFFAVLLGGSIYDFAFATFNGLILAVCLYLLGKLHMNIFCTNVLCAGAVAMTSSFVLHVLKIPIALDVVISGSILPLVPGVAITNAIRDTLQGDYLSGGTRAIEAFVMATSIAIGIGLGLAVFK